MSERKPLADLTAEELAMLVHALQMVPANACLTGNSLARLAPGKGLAFFHEIPAFTSLWEKTAQAFNTRRDTAPFRSSASAGTTERKA